MKVNRLIKENCLDTRKLWETAFPEDSPAFVDYYYQEKAVDNIAYVIGEKPYESMMFCTPYLVQVYGQICKLPYIVGVATREDCRRQGRMAAMLHRAMEDLYREKTPFAFLMPANPKIYKPFAFSYVYERWEWEFVESKFVRENLEPLIGRKTEILVEGHQGKGRLFSLSGQDEQEKQRLFSVLGDYANQWLRDRFEIYVRRDAQYYERQLKELLAQNGDIFFLQDQQNKLLGFFLYAREGEGIFLQEVLADQPGCFAFLRKKEQKKPIIMARIIHLEEMMKLVKGKENRSLLLAVRDSVLPENTGLYLWEISPNGSRVTRQDEEKRAEISLTIEELAPLLIQNVFLNEIV